MKTILAAVDFSNATPGVLELATTLAKATGAELRLIHVLEPEPSYTAYGFTPEEFPAMNTFHEEARKRAARQLETLEGQVRQSLPGTTSVLAEGSPLPTLLGHVRDSGADFIIVGSHGHGVLASLLLGSVAEGLVRKATVPTLVVPAVSH